MKKNFWKTVLLSWLLVGSLDILAAFANYYIKTGKDPIVVLKYIASAVFGPSAYSDGAYMSVYGLLFHFVVAFIWTLLFFLIYPKLKLFSINRVLVAMLYGIVIWLVMNFAVVPLTKAGTGTFVLKDAIISALILVFAIGLPLSFIAHWFYSRATKF